MPNSTRIFVSPSALFIAGMIASHPALRTLTAYSLADTSITHRVRKDRILEALLRNLPCLPPFGAANDTADYDHIWSQAALPKDEPLMRLYGKWWEAAIALTCDEAERLFVTRCAALLNALCRHGRPSALPVAAGQDV